MTKIAVFGNSSQQRRMFELRNEARKLGVQLDLISYNEMRFETNGANMFLGGKPVNYYDIYFFRNSKDHWEEVNLIVGQLSPDKIVVDPVMMSARPSDVCKAVQMITLAKAGLPVPKTVYGSLEYLSTTAVRDFRYPLIIKGSKGDRHEQVFKVMGPKGLARHVAELTEAETAGANKFMMQEYIRNTEDYRIIVVGNKALGVMKRAIGDNPRRRDEFSQASDLPRSVKDVAIEASRVCGIAVAGVDIVLKNGTDPMIYEVNKTPCYDRFEEVFPEVNVAKEVVQYLIGLSDH